MFNIFILSLRMQSNTSLLFKYGTIYREVMRLSRIDFCTIINFWLQKGFVDNVLFNFMLKVATESIPKNIIHKCPYNVDTHKILNFISACSNHFISGSQCYKHLHEHK